MVRKSSIEAKRRFLMQIANALQNGFDYEGTGHRPSLPSELVAYIFRFANITIAVSIASFTSEIKPFAIRDDARTKPAHIWFEVAMSKELLLKRLKLRLLTLAGHQGWSTADNCRSWFEIAILSAGVEVCSSAEESYIHVR